MKYLFILPLWLVALPLLAQNNENDKKFGIEFSGFVKTDYWYDSRKIQGTRDDLLCSYPLPKDLDKNGKDINDKSSLNFSPISTRLMGKISGPDAFGAKTMGIMEMDFTGSSSAGINELRLRHAYVKLSWTKFELLTGQYWHPMFVPEVFPDVLSFNTGAPFQPFVRSPQILISYQILPSIKIMAAAITQRDNASNGPDKASPVYLQNARLPNLHLQVQFKNDVHVAGLAVDYKRIMPRIVIDTLVTDECVSSFSYMAYYKLKLSKFTFRFKSILGQNLSEFLMPGGYAVKSVDTLGIQTYTTYNHIVGWINATYGEKIIVGFYAGYCKNLGTSDNSLNTYYTMWTNDPKIASLVRVAPSLSFISGKFKVSSELEFTLAEYGTPDPNDKNRVKSTPVQNIYKVHNVRILAAAIYSF